MICALCRPAVEIEVQRLYRLGGGTEPLCSIHVLLCGQGLVFYIASLFIYIPLVESEAKLNSSNMVILMPTFIVLLTIEL